MWSSYALQKYVLWLWVRKESKSKDFCTTGLTVLKAFLI